jgi:hypothetical protein
MKENTFYNFYFKNQNFLHKPQQKSLKSLILDLKKDKIKLYSKIYKKFIRLTCKKETKHVSLIKPKALFKEKILILNKKLTKKELQNLDVLNNNKLYKNLDSTELLVGNLRGYTTYYDEVYSSLKTKHLNFNIYSKNFRHGSSEGRADDC